MDDSLTGFGSVNAFGSLNGFGAVRLQHKEWYWWDLASRATSWNNPRARLQKSDQVRPQHTTAEWDFNLTRVRPIEQVMLRTADGKRVHVEDVQMISEDGGTSSVKQVSDKAGVHYALKVMRKTDVHWENVLNEKQVRPST